MRKRRKMKVKAKMITLTNVDNTGKSVNVRDMGKLGLRCECNADFRYCRDICWWCGGIQNKGV